MEKSSFFNSVSGDRRYSAEDWAAYFASFVSNGVFASPSTSLQIMGGSGMNITIKVGSGFIRGYFYQNTTELSKTIAVADGIDGRIDRVVLRWSLTDRKISTEILTGTPESTPSAPALTRSNTVYELALADILVGAGVTEIAQSAITDRRADSSLCGFVTGVVNQFDFSTLCTQFEAFFPEYQEKISDSFADFVDQGRTKLTEYLENMEAYETNAQGMFTDWFVLLQNTLDENTAGNLQNQISGVASRAFSIYTHSKTGTVHSLTLSGGGNHLLFKATAAYAHGDSFKMNGVNVSVRLTNGAGLGDGYFASGSVIYGYKDGSTLYLSGGNGSFCKEISVAAGSGWTQNTGGGYVQNISVSGLLASDRPTISFVPPDSFSDLTVKQTAFGQLYDCAAQDGILKLYAKDPPDSAFTILLEVNRI